MSQENMAMVRRIYEDGWLDHGPDRVLTLVAPDAEYVNPPEAVEPGIRRGAAELAHAFQSFSESFDSSRHELHELFDGGDSVVAWVSFCTRIGGSQNEVVQK